MASRNKVFSGMSVRCWRKITTRGIGSANRMSPVSGFMSPHKMPKSVVFPLPFGPIKPRRSPGAISKSSSRNSVRPSKPLLIPVATTKRRVRRPLAVKSTRAPPAPAASLRAAMALSTSRRSALSSMRLLALVPRPCGPRDNHTSSMRTSLASVASARPCASRNSSRRRRNSL